MSFVARDKDGNKIKRNVVIDCQKAIKNGEKVRVEQAHKKEVDINNIVKKHGVDMLAKTQLMQEMRFDDVTGNDFQEAAIIIARAEQSFNSFPAFIRSQFDNDPAKFLDFAQNPENQEKLIELGLANRRPVEEPVKVLVMPAEEPVSTPETPKDTP
jgi:phage internal scaffolding protein